MDDHREETLALLKLSMCKRVSNRTIFALTEHFGSARSALEASAGALGQVDGVAAAAAAAIQRRPDRGAVDRELELMENHRTRLVPFFSEDYPRPLRYLEQDAPVLLRIRGEWRREDQLALAIVGSRRCSVYGRRQATRFACDLAGMGFTVVSGMAAGVDTAAHRGALLAKGRTVAVLGCGLAHRLHAEDAALAAEIAENGAVISELPMEAPPLAKNFPPRNRLISGLSLGVVVVEAAERSGSLITARLAGEQGRMVFAVPGAVDSPASRGCHRLIRDGAVLVENARDVLDGLGPLSEPIQVATCREDEAPPLEDPRVLALNDRERYIYNLIGPTPQHIDEVVAETKLAPSIVSSTLMTLEIRGLISQLNGQRYVRG